MSPRQCGSDEEEGWAVSSESPGPCGPGKGRRACDRRVLP